MGKVFNISGDCKANLHYMVNIEERLIKMKEMVRRGDYFTINRARQYGKTTTLRALSRFLQKEYIVVSLDFQRMGAAKFSNENIFSAAFAKMMIQSVKAQCDKLDMYGREALREFEGAVQTQKDTLELFELFGYVHDICGNAAKPLILIIDEADFAAGNQVFLDFLAQLRADYIDRDETPAFQSVILAGVYDFKQLRGKTGTGENHKQNSPWNIAVDFLDDMSFSKKDIAGMLEEYEKDHGTGMDEEAVASLLYEYTSGYPFLVSYICKLADERLACTAAGERCAWTKEHILEAVRILLTEQNTLFESLIHKLQDDPDLHEMLRNLLFRGKQIDYTIGVRSVEVARMLGFVKKQDYRIVLANRIFETLLYNWFLAAPEMRRNTIYDTALKEKNQFICYGRLNMELVLEKFVQHFDELYGDRQQSFLEEDGRRYFLLYLMPIINGTGNYYVEARTRNMERTDVIVDYLGEQFVIELKIWHGNAYHERGEAQIAEYLEYYHLEKGYMLSFNFNKTKQTGVKTIQIGPKTIVEAVV